MQIQVLSPSGELRSLGSGFVATADGLLITNHHVIDGANRMEAVFADSKRLKVTGVALDDPEHDIAVVRVEPSSPLIPLPFGSAARAVVGDPVMLIGSPFGLDLTVSVGAVSQYRPDGFPAAMLAMEREAKPTDRKPMLQITAAAGQGNSGGPVLDATGAVLGIVQSGIGTHGNFTFAVPSESLQAALAQAQLAPKDSSPDGRLVNIGISALAFGIVAAFYTRVRRSS